VRLPVRWRVTATGKRELPRALEHLPRSERDWLGQHAGATLESGLLRFHNENSYTLVINDVRARYGDGFRPFCFDWMGRQLALTTAGDTAVLDIGWNDVLVADVSLAEFFGAVLEEEGEDLVRADLWDEWRLEDAVALEFDECVGYKVPIFLGGADATANLERTNLGVYWGITSQLAIGVAGLPDGTSVGRVEIE
jgi:hypothetical protein